MRGWWKAAMWLSVFTSLASFLLWEDPRDVQASPLHFLSPPGFYPHQMHPLHSLIFSLLALESTFLLILRRSVLQESSTVLSFGIGLQLLPFQVHGGCGSLFCFWVARKCIPIKHKKDTSGGRWRGHTYHVTLWNTRNTCNVQSQCYLNWFS